MSGRPVVVKDPTVQYDDEVLLTRDRAWTVVEVPTVPFTFRSPQERFEVGVGVTRVLAGLPKGPLVVRSVHARGDEEAHVRRVLDRAVAGGSPRRGFEAFTRAGEAQAMRVAPTEKRVFWQVGLGRRSAAAQAHAGVEGALRGDPFALVPGQEMSRWGAEARRVRADLGSGPLRSSGVSARLLRSVRRRAVARGALLVDGRPVRAAGWGRAEIEGEFADLQVDALARAARVEGPGGVVFVATLTVSAMPSPMPFPETPPWLSVLDRIDGFTVDTDLRVDLQDLRRSLADVTRLGRLARTQRAEALQGGVDAHPETADMERLARALAKDLPLRRQPLAYGWARIRVDAPSLVELDARCREVERVMGRVAGEGIDVRRLPGDSQVRLLFEGVPGLGVGDRQFRQRWSLATVGCALPQAGSTLGHRSGSYRGWSTGRQRNAVRIDLHHAITKAEGEPGHVQRGGGTTFFGDTRAGKSGALSQILTVETVAGRPMDLIDAGANGPLAKLATGVPALAGLVEVVDLSDLGGGAADPMGRVLIPDPPRPVVEDDASVEAWERALRVVRKERQELARETVEQIAHRLMLGPQGPDATTALLHALGTVSTSADPSLRAVIDVLQSARGDRAAVNLGALLDFEFDTADASALAGSGGRSLDAAPLVGEGRPTTRIITMRDLATLMPDAQKPVSEWTPSESLAAGTFSCSLHMVRRSLFGAARLDHRTASGDLRLRTLAVDEAHNVLATKAGYRAIDTSLKHGPKLGIATLVSTHNASVVDQRLHAGISQHLLFRSTSGPELTASHEAAGIADTAELHEHRSNFDNGECLAVLDTGDVDRMRFDLEWIPGLAQAADTTPLSQKVPS